MPTVGRSARRVVQVLCNSAAVGARDRPPGSAQAAGSAGLTLAFGCRTGAQPCLRTIRW